MRAIKHIVLLNLLFISTICLSQGVSQLEKEKSNLKAEISYTNKLLEESRKMGSNTLNQIELLKKKIQLREKMMSNISREMRGLENAIKSNEDEIQNLEAEIQEMKRDYASLIELSYKTRSTESKLLYIFSSESFGQAARRTRYLKEISKLRERQVILIEQAKSDLKSKNEVLVKNREQQEKLLVMERAEKKSLSKDKASAESKFSEIKQNEKKLRKKLKQQEAKRQKLAKEIQRLIEMETKKIDGPKTFQLTPDEQLIAGNFYKNKGKLPWPVERGIVTGKFGSHAHPELKGIVVSNNGIDITTEKNAMVRALFKGEVTGIITIPGAGKAVMLKHGDYWTVYSNLNKVFVEKGDKLDTKELIGTLIEEGAISKSHIEIWKHSSKGMVKLDPEHWIAK